MPGTYNPIETRRLDSLNKSAFLRKAADSSAATTPPFEGEGRVDRWALAYNRYLEQEALASIARNHQETVAMMGSLARRPQPTQHERFMVPATIVTDINSCLFMAAVIIWAMVASQSQVYP